MTGLIGPFWKEQWKEWDSRKNGLKRWLQCTLMHQVKLYSSEEKQTRLGYHDQLDKGVLRHPIFFFFL